LGNPRIGSKDAEILYRFLMMVDPQTATSQKFWDTKLGSLVLGVLGWGIFLGVWQVLSSLATLPILPGPASIFLEERTHELLLNPLYDKGGIDKGLFWLSIYDLTFVMRSCFWAGVVGIGLGILLGINQVVSKIFEPVIAFLRILPPVLLLLFALVVADKNGLFVLDAWIAFWPILRNTTRGVKKIPEEYRSVGQILRFSHNQFFQVMAPLALPYILIGIRKALVLTWCLHNSISAYGGGVVSLGFSILEAFQNNYISELILALIYVGYSIYLYDVEKGKGLD
jgi:bicarbonate transport system permease protein